MGINDNLQPVAWAVSMPFVVITGMSSLLRVYSRICISKQFGIDDWFMVGASITWLANEAILGQMLVFGGGKETDEVPPENIHKIVLLLFIIEFIYIFCQWLIKMSFLTFYVRVLSNTVSYRILLFCVMAFTSAQTLSMLLFYGLQCIPLGTFFYPENYPDGKCIPTPITLYVPASLNVLTDLMIYILPIYPLWNLQMSVQRRIGLIACFTVGGGTILVSLLRFIVLVQLASGSRTFYVYGSVAIVTTIELCTAILTGNMPALRSVWKVHISHSAYAESSSNKLSNHELGTFSQARSSRKADKGSVALRSQPGTNQSAHGSEEELFQKNGDIVVSTQFRVNSSAHPSTQSEELPSSYYQFDRRNNSNV